MSKGERLIVKVVEVNPKNGKLIKRFENKALVAKSLKSPSASVSHASKNKQVYTVKGRLFADFPKGEDLSEEEVKALCEAAMHIHKITKGNQLDIPSLNKFNESAKFVVG